MNNCGMEYTIPNIPEELVRALREKATADGKSLNEAIVDTLKAAVRSNATAVKKRDLSDLAGTWVEDPEFDRAIEEQDRIDPELWK